MRSSCSFDSICGGACRLTRTQVTVKVPRRWWRFVVQNTVAPVSVSGVLGANSIVQTSIPVLVTVLASFAPPYRGSQISYYVTTNAVKKMLATSTTTDTCDASLQNRLAPMQPSRQNDRSIPSLRQVLDERVYLTGPEIFISVAPTTFVRDSWPIDINMPDKLFARLTKFKSPPLSTSFQLGDFYVCPFCETRSWARLKAFAKHLVNRHAR